MKHGLAVFLRELLRELPTIVGAVVSIGILWSGVQTHNDARITHALLLILIVIAGDINNKLTRKDKP